MTTRKHGIQQLTVTNYNGNVNEQTNTQGNEPKVSKLQTEQAGNQFKL